MADNETKYEAEQLFGCCGFSNQTEGVKCETIDACKTSLDSCPPCAERIQGKINYAFNAAGGLGLFFSFTEVGIKLFRVIDSSSLFIHVCGCTLICWKPKSDTE